MSVNRSHVYCVIPVFNDWDSLLILLKQIAEVQAQHDAYTFSAVVVDDGSFEERPDRLLSILPLTLLTLKRNVGHQRAIAVGLQFANQKVAQSDYVIVMDGDGEDPPAHLIALLEKARLSGDRKIIFAARNKRQESRFFKLGYIVYKYLFYSLTGQKISFGNFSVIPAPILKRVVYLDAIWNHYSGGILQSKIPHDKVVLDRGKRYKGQSKMNVSALVLHGLSSIAVYFDQLSLRILRFCTAGFLLCATGIAYILYQKLFTDNAIPGWASSLILIIGVIMVQLFSVTLVTMLLQLSSRKKVQPPNDLLYQQFILSETANEETIFP
ncbi:MAG TPA: glycosyltransferase [Flavobacterium sp.]|nr:glycosyltransferase [Flavobacterium sp.]